MTNATKMACAILTCLLLLRTAAFSDAEVLRARLHRLGFEPGKSPDLLSKSNVTVKYATQVLNFKLEDMRGASDKSRDFGIRRVEKKDHVIDIYSEPPLSNADTWTLETKCDLVVSIRDPKDVYIPRPWKGHPMKVRLEKLGFALDPESPEIMQKRKVTVHYVGNLFGFNLADLVEPPSQGPHQNLRYVVTNEYYIMLSSDKVFERRFEDWTMDTKIDVKVRLLTDWEKLRK